MDLLKKGVLSEDESSFSFVLRYIFFLHRSYYVVRLRTRCISVMVVVSVSRKAFRKAE